MLTTPRALLFDLGGVLLDIDFGLAINAWAAYSALPETELARLFHFDREYRQHERGELDSAAYFAHLAARLQLSASPAQIEAGWNAIFVGEIAETAQLLQSARSRLPCYLLTNTNESHMRFWSARYPDLLPGFDAVFASHQLGLRKPEPTIFRHVLQTTGVAAADILFFDDTAENIEAAKRAGLQAVLVRSSVDIAEGLEAVGVI
ncbi:HAD-IA family hydrolase [Methylomonas sp. HYX-M1]|uniref:HAD-IA family hydrolase n=1 Tax=Methylomonas sp. HYX-M1 TaxID=3139307 RepID=UPI00345C5F26